MRAERQALKGKVQTVLGPVEPEALGQVLMHEHLVWDIRSPLLAAMQNQGPMLCLCNYHETNYGRTKVPRNLISKDVELATREVGYMKEAGGGTVVELSSGGLSPDPLGLQTISRETGAHIVMGCGHYVDEYQPAANHERSVDDFAEEMISQVFEGAWGTDVRAGMIGEIGCQSPWTDTEKRVMKAAIIAEGETGAALNVHPGRDSTQPQEVMGFVAAEGGRPERVVISHIDRTIFDRDEMCRLADTGCILEFDLFGQETSYYGLNPKIDMPNDAVRLRHIRALIDRGHLDQIVISHDICYVSRLKEKGGHGYGHIFQNVLPLMRDRDFTEAEIGAIMVETPQRILAFI